MRQLLKLEELFLFFFGIWMFSTLDYSWWWFPALLLLPDIGMIGYLFGNKAGAFCYNLFHHRAVAIGVYLSGVFTENPALQLAGVILFSHIAMDRMLGYGLKYNTGFSETHLGSIGQRKKL